MMRILSLLLSVIILGSCGTGDPEMKQELHGDHTVFAVNKLPPRASFIAYETKELAEQNKPEASERFISLNGEWKFHWARSPRKRAKKFYHPDLDDRQWENIPVPANWEVEGFGRPIYLDERYPFSTTWPDAPGDYNPVGTYRHEFSIPEAWTGQQIILHFAAAKSAMYLYINGQFTGYSQGSKTPAEFDVSSFVRPGPNLLSMQMYRWSDASYLESQDMLRMSGIEREVYLYARPRVNVTDFQVDAGLDTDYRDGLFRLRTAIENQLDSIAQRELIVRISHHGKTLYEDIQTLSIPAGGMSGASSETRGRSGKQPVYPGKYWFPDCGDKGCPTACEW